MQEPGTKTKYGCVVRQNSPHPSRCTRCTGCSPRLQTRPREGHGPSQGSNLGLPEEAPHPRSLAITSCQAEIVKRLSGICAQIIPFLTQEVSGPGAGQGESCPPSPQLLGVNSRRALFGDRWRVVAPPALLCCERPSRPPPGEPGHYPSVGAAGARSERQVACLLYTSDAADEHRDV